MEEPMKLNSLQELYIEQLRDLYDGERQIIDALPELIEAATAEELKEALSEHLDVTKFQVKRLENIFTKLGEKPKGETCQGLEGVIEEGGDLVDAVENTEVRDAAIIASAQRVEHYEMAGYGTARTFATLLGEVEAGQLLQETLNEEKEADDKLTALAENINRNAKEGKSVAGEKATKRKKQSVA
jgi:ferritin-like metal-binding protein YciE